MYSYREQLDIIEKISVREGTGINVNCPFCGGRKTLGIANKSGAKLWHCFKASCGAKGSIGVGMSTGAMLRRINGIEDGARAKKLIDIPEHLAAIENYPAVIQYLEDNNAIEAYRSGLIRVVYAPVDKRVLFFTKNGKGAVGRSLGKEIPKWKQYGLIDRMFKVGNGSKAIVVEDAVSACSIARFTNCSGCALLGTTLTSIVKAQLCTYQEVVIALDKDASRQAVKLSKRLEGRVKTSVILLEEDFKYLSCEDIKKAYPRLFSIPVSAE